MFSIHHLESELKKLPFELQGSIATSLKQFAAQLTELDSTFKPAPEIISSIVKVWCGSRFIAENCLRQAELLVDLHESGDLMSDYSEQTYRHKLAAINVESEAGLMTGLRQLRRREMIRIAWRDIAGWASLNETLTDLSHLADACIQFALDFLYQQACENRGTPVLSNGQPQQMIVLGMGKLGAYELNFSSDIDLIFAYAEDGVLADRKSTTYGEFFTRLCQSLVKVLDEITVDGFVFRIDIRLRPYGDSGAIIMTFDGMENYYLTQAREWERYAMIKVRQVAGDLAGGLQLLAMLKSFVYRRYLDYGAFEELRALKLQITRELRRKDRLENIKLGPGGIREIEFIGQAFQLIRGGAEQTLKIRGILEVLQRLKKLELLTGSDADQLTQSYCLLRQVENRIQQYQDRQTHDLPADPLAQQILAYTLNYRDWISFKNDLDTVRKNLHAIFEQVFSLSKQEVADSASQKIWRSAVDREELVKSLRNYGFGEPEDTLDVVEAFKNSAPVRRLSAKGAAVLNRLMPQFIEALREVDNPDETIRRVLGLFEKIAGRNVYLALLSENPDALTQLLRLSSASFWISDYLAQYPILLDEFLDHRALFQPLKKVDLDDQLQSILATVDSRDIEALMFKLREFKQLNVLRVAAADIMRVIPVMVVSDYLTYIAESIVNQVVERAWMILAEKHGNPPHCNLTATKFAVIGFGKFGGLELGYGSDLDLVFLYDCPDGNAMTDGPKPVSCSLFYGRLGLKVRHILDTRLLSGVLYDVDMRLRPSGDSGLLVAHINSYEDYYRNQAWTWEHQALVRGRFIAGDQRLKLQFEAIRHRILSLPRDSEQLKREVSEMREKMRAALETQLNDKFDLKQSKGGIADIEFIVQFGVLDQASNNEALTTYTDNVRLLESLQAHGFFAKNDAETLKAAYCAYRDYGHKRVLQGNLAVIDEAEVAEMKARVEKIWHDYMD